MKQLGTFHVNGRFFTNYIRISAYNLCLLCPESAFQRQIEGFVKDKQNGL